MKAEDLFGAIGAADEVWLEESEQPRRRKPPKTRLALAACLCLVLFAAALWLPLQHNPPASPVTDTPTTTDPEIVAPESITPELPTLELTAPEYDGAGQYAILSSDLTAMLSDHPGSRAITAAALPVYRNRTYRGGYLPPTLDVELAAEKIHNTATALEQTIITMRYYASDGTLLDPENPGQEVFRIEADTGAATLTISDNTSLTIYFTEPVSLPGELCFLRTGATDAQAQQAIESLMAQYDRLLSYTQPQTALSGDDTYSGLTTRRYLVYEAGETQSQCLLGYYFCYTEFFPTEDGELSAIRITDCSAAADYLADYPVITADQARQLLLSSEDLCLSENLPVNEADIAACELVYRTEYWQANWMPYYRFWVACGQTGSGVPQYQTYDVPAVQSQYLQFPQESEEIVK